MITRVALPEMTCIRQREEARPEILVTTRLSAGNEDGSSSSAMVGKIEHNGSGICSGRGSNETERM